MLMEASNPWSQRRKEAAKEGKNKEKKTDGC
jgi:hypothetical protein